MKREMELIRKIALAVEEEPTGFARENPVIDGYTEEQIAYHVYLMLEAGLVRGDDLGNHDNLSSEAIANGLTWDGHEFLDAARDDTLWNKTMGFVRGKVGTISFEVLRQLLTYTMKQNLGLPTVLPPI